MKIHQKILLPFTGLYAVVIKMWSCLQKRHAQSYDVGLKVISVGNLQVGGTGKTPMVEYLCQTLSQQYKVAVLSRGYKRKSKGYKVVEVGNDHWEVGDEPLQIKRKYPHIDVIVCENRKNGLIRIKEEFPKVQLVILDDGYQQIALKKTKDILMTTFDQPFTTDVLLPSGKLRESKKEASRADCIIVSKCPLEMLSQKEKALSLLGIQPLDHQQVFLSSILYDEPYVWELPDNISPLMKEEAVLLVTGIANAHSLRSYLESKVDKILHLEFPDHHTYTIDDIKKIEQAFMSLGSRHHKRLVTTDKDISRLIQFNIWFSNNNIKLFVQPIRLEWDDEGALLEYLIV